ncbi:MAG: hypothetical protein ACR2OB_11270 [Solirubrobacteraceae bacterium]
MQANTALAELRAEGDEVQDGAPEPIQPRDFRVSPSRSSLSSSSSCGRLAFGTARAVDVDRVPGDAGT